MIMAACSKFRAPTQMVQYEVLAIPPGYIAWVVGTEGLLYTLLGGDIGMVDARIAALIPNARRNQKLLPSLRSQLQRYFDGKPVRFDVRIDFVGVPPFSRRVLAACSDIPYGQTRTYGELARQVGSPAAARAVGQAMAHNRVPIVIPCHRVVGSAGLPGGFSAEQGVSLKRWLLELERDGAESR